MRIFFTAMLLLAPLPALAQSPFEFGGLHTDLVFSDAVLKAQQLGGTCKVAQSRSGNGGVKASCELLPCTVGTEVGVCQERHALPTKLAIGAQPIVSVGLDAQAESSALQRIVFRYDGSFDALTQNLIKQFGSPANDGASSEQQSWNHSRQLRWRSGDYTMALVNTPKLVILTNTPAAEPAAR